MALATAPRLFTPGTLSRAQNPNDYAVAKITEQVNQLRMDFAERNALYKDIDAVIFGDRPVWIPAAFRKTALEVHSPLAIHIVNTVTAALSINPITYQFRPTGFGDAANENATRRERFFESSWERQMEEARRRLDRLFMASMVTKGEGVLKTVERSKRAWGDYDAYSQRLQKALESDPDYREFDQHARDHLYDRQTEEYKLQAPYPIATTDVPPETFFYVKNEDGFTYECEVKQVPYYQTLARYGATLDGRGKVMSQEQIDPHAVGLAVPEHDWSKVMSGTRMLTCAEVYDAEGYCTVILVGPGQSSSSSSNLGNGTAVKRFKHGLCTPMGTLRGPYFHALGVTTASRLPHRAGLGILFGFLRLFPLLDSMITSQGNAAFMTGFPAYKRTLPPGTVPGLPMTGAPFGSDGVEGEAAEEKIEPGTIYPYDVAPIDQPRSGPEMDKTIGMVRQFLELALPSIVQGVVSGDESGYALNQAQFLARISWQPIIGNAEIAHAERVGHESWLIEHRIGEKVYAWGEAPRKRRGGGAYRTKTASGWQSIGPDDLHGTHKYRARLDPQTPSNEVIETRAIKEQLDAQLVTWEDAVERLGNNPDEVERSAMLREMKADPVIKSKLRERVLQKLGLLDAQAIQGPPGSVDPLAELAGQMPPGGPGGLPDVFMPGQNGVPLTPTPQGSVTGLGPAGRAMAGQVAGMPNVQNLPANARPLPGQ